MNDYLVTYNKKKTIIVPAIDEAQAQQIVKTFVPRVLIINNVQNLSKK